MDKWARNELIGALEHWLGGLLLGKDMSNVFPARYVGISAGYGVVTPEEADEAALFKMLTDTMAGRSNRTLLLSRFREEDIDVSKFLFPLLPGVPVAGLSVLNIMGHPYLSPVATGSRDLETTVAVANVTRPEGRPRTKFALEGKSFGDNFRVLGREVELPRREPMVILTGDIPLSYDVFWSLLDQEMPVYDALIDMNARENMPDLFSRNYYFRFKTPEGRILTWKEPNRFMGNPHGLHVVSRIMDILFKPKNRKGGGLFNAALELFPNLLPLLVTHPVLSLKTGLYAASEVTHTKWQWLQPDARALTEDAGSLVSEYAINAPWQIYWRARLRVKAQHQDPFSVRDIDGLHDYLMMRAILEHEYYSTNPASIANLSSIYPHTEHLAAFQEEMLARGPELVKRSDEILNAWIERLNYVLPAFRDSPKLDEIRDRSKMDAALRDLERMQLPPPIVDGRVNLGMIALLEGKTVPEVEANIEAYVDYLRNTYMPGFKQHQLAYGDAIYRR